tara:strand:+ start:117 stop:1046 length:930 start_codon:yes stop_codon:yes gene_type:complete
MKIGLIPFDSKLPNLALMKLSAYHKSKGDTIGLLKNMGEVDKIYVSVIFPKNKTGSFGLKVMYPDTEIVYGGSAINYDCLPNNIEHIMPDYDLYGIDYSMGFTTRGCIRQCSFCIVRNKEGYLRFHAPLKEFVNPEFKKLILLDNNLLAYKNHLDILKEIKERDLKVDFNQGLDIRLLNEKNANLLSQIKYYNHKFNVRTLRFAYDNTNDKPYIKRGVRMLLDAGIRPRNIFFYVLAYTDNILDAVHRVNVLKELGCRPFIMPYNQIFTKEMRKLQHWVDYMPYYSFIEWEDFNSRTKNNKDTQNKTLF